MRCLLLFLLYFIDAILLVAAGNNLFLIVV